MVLSAAARIGPPLGHSVLVVVASSTQPQMVRVDARGVVASVADVEVAGIAHKGGVADSMCPAVRAPIGPPVEHPVTSGVGAACPPPAPGVWVRRRAGAQNGPGVFGRSRAHPRPRGRQSPRARQRRETSAALIGHHRRARPEPAAPKRAGGSGSAIPPAVSRRSASARPARRRCGLRASRRPPAPGSARPR